MDVVRFAIVGCGRIAYRHVEAIDATPNAELVAVCDLRLERAMEKRPRNSVKVYENYHDMLEREDIDVVNIITPSGMHAEHAMDIMKHHRKHVVIEKPIVLRLSEGRQLLETAKELGLEVFPVHQNRFNKAVQKIKSAIDERLFGKLVLGTIRIRWSRGQAYYDRDPWRGKWAFDGGALTNQAIHHIDLLRWFLGDVTAVSAIACTRLVNIEVEDTAVGWLKFDNGGLGAIEVTTATRPLDRDLEASISLLGEFGTVIVEGTAVNKLTAWTFGDIDYSRFSEDPPDVYGFGHNDIMANVVDTLRGSTRPLISGDDALRSIQLLHALYRSIELNGKEVYLRDAPISEKLGVIDRIAEPIANLYRTPYSRSDPRG